MRRSLLHHVLRALFVAMLLVDGAALAHSGPPFPIVSSRAAGAYELSVWTDPDATDDGQPGGQFWVTVRAASGGQLPPDTRVTVAISPADRPGATHTGIAEPVAGDPGNRFIALLMDHEGPFSVRVRVDGSLGPAMVESAVEATYDLRPPPIMLAIYAVPFLLVGLLWVKLLLKRRSAGATRTPGRGDSAVPAERRHG